MPNLSLPVQETEQSILRPSVFDIVRQVKAITKLPADTPILYPGGSQNMQQPGSAVSTDQGNRTQFSAAGSVMIEVDEQNTPGSFVTTSVASAEHLPIFLDDKIGVVIKPVYASTDITLNIKFYSKSKTTAERWRSDMVMKTSMMRDANLHQVSYHYLIPAQYLEILKEIHRAREALAGYGQDFPTYLLAHSTRRLTELSNQSGEKTAIGVSETQMRIVGYFDYSEFPDNPEKDDDSGTWMTGFAYKFKFDKAIGCNMRYPVMVHNHVLGENFRPTDKAYDLDDHQKSFSLSGKNFNYFEAALQIDHYVNTKANLVIPSFDEFIPTSIPIGTVSIFSALCQISEQDKRSLLNFNELGDVHVDSDILHFMKESEYPYLTEPYQSILHVSLYRSMHLSNYDAVEVDAALDVRSNVDLSLRVNHRVRFSVVANLALLDKAALDRLRRYPAALVKIVKAINEALRNNPGFSDLQNKPYVSPKDMASYVLNPNSVYTRNTALRDEQIRLNTVQTTYIVAKKLPTSAP